MTYKRTIVIVDRESEQQDISSRLSEAFRGHNEHHLIEFKTPSSMDELSSLLHQRPDVVILGYQPDFTPQYPQMLNGTDRRHVVFTFLSEHETSARQLATELGIRHSLQKSPILEERTEGFTRDLVTSVYDCLTSYRTFFKDGSEVIGRTMSLGIDGTGGIGGAVADLALGEAAIRKIYLYNGKNRAKAELLARELRDKALRSSVANACEIYVIDDIEEMKYACGIRVHTHGDHQTELNLAIRQRKTRKDFLRLNIATALQHSEELIGAGGIDITVTNPVAPLTTVYYAGTYRVPDSYDSVERFCIPEGLCMSDKKRGLQVLLSIAKDLGLVENGDSLVVERDFDFKIVGPRENFIIVDPIIKDLTFEQLQEIALKRNRNPQMYNETSLTAKIREGIHRLGIGQIIKSGDYFPATYARQLMDHIRSINGIPDLKGQEIRHPAVVLVDLFKDSDFEESANRLVTYHDYGGRKEKTATLRELYDHLFPNGVITSWEISHKNGISVNDSIPLKTHKKRRKLLEALIEDRNLLMGELDRVDERLGQQAQKVKTFFTEKLSS